MERVTWRNYIRMTVNKEIYVTLTSVEIYEWGEISSQEMDLTGFLIIPSSEIHDISETGQMHVLQCQDIHPHSYLSRWIYISLVTFAT